MWPRYENTFIQTQILQHTLSSRYVKTGSYTCDYEVDISHFVTRCKELKIGSFWKEFTKLRYNHFRVVMWRNEVPPLGCRYNCNMKVTSHRLDVLLSIFRVTMTFYQQVYQSLSLVLLSIIKNIGRKWNYKQMYNIFKLDLIPFWNASASLNN